MIKNAVLFLVGGGFVGSVFGVLAARGAMKRALAAEAELAAQKRRNTALDGALKESLDNERRALGRVSELTVQVRRMSER